MNSLLFSFLKACSQHTNWTDLNKSTQLLNAFNGHAYQRHNYIALIGCSETRPVSAQLVLNTFIPMRLFTLESVNSSSHRISGQFSSCAVNKPLASMRCNGGCKRDTARICCWAPGRAAINRYILPAEYPARPPVRLSVLACSKPAAS